MWIRSSRGNDLLTGVECLDFFFDLCCKKERSCKTKVNQLRHGLPVCCQEAGLQHSSERRMTTTLLEMGEDPLMGSK